MTCRRLVPLVLTAAFALAALPGRPAPAAAAAKAPTEIAGLTIGADAESLRDRLDLSRLAPLWDRPWLIRANLKPTKGFSAGYVILGGCATTNRVERVRLKYKDGSLALFNKLAKELTARYGVPLPVTGKKDAKYKGLRWLFGTNKATGLDILLEHFENGTDEETAGNIIRLTDNGAIAQERACYDGLVRGAPEPQPAFPLFDIDDSWLLPK